jgi:plastocyanin
MKLSQKYLSLIIFLVVITLLILFLFLYFNQPREIYISKKPEQKLLEPKYYNVVITTIAYLPSAIIINKGDVVVFKNSDNKNHTVYFNSTGIDSGIILPGNNYSYKFNDKGNYHFSCKLHPYMKGEIIVE